MLTHRIIYFLRKEFKQIFLRYRNVKYKLVTVHINSRLSMPKKRNCILTAPFFCHLIMFRCRIPLPVLPYTVSYNTQSHILKFYPLRSPGVLHHISFPLSAVVPVKALSQATSRFPSPAYFTSIKIAVSLFSVSIRISL